MLARRLAIGRRLADNAIMASSSVESVAPLEPRFSGLPAWLLSLAAHLAVAILGALLINVERPVIDRDDGDRRAAIVLADRTVQRTNYFSDEDRPSGIHEARTPAIGGGAAAEVAGGSPAAAQPPLIPGISLPALPGNLPV